MELLGFGEAHLRVIFNEVDKDKSGEINFAELQSALSNGSWKPFNPNIIRMMITLFDVNDSGTINFDEFKDLWEYISKWTECFHVCDIDKTGLISPEELKKGLERLGYTISLATADAYVNIFDRSNGSEKLCFDDFMEVCIEVAKRHHGLNIHEKIMNKMF